MASFKKGDLIRKVDGSRFSTGFEVAYVNFIQGEEVHIVGGGWLLECYVKHGYPNPPHKHAELIKAWADGAVIQFWDGRCQSWVDTSNNRPFWAEGNKYRIKPSNPNADKIAEIESTISELQQQLKELKDANI